MQHDLRKTCIHACLGCYQTCLEMAMTHCLQAGGEHVAPDHFRLMASCAEICRTAAHLMLGESAQQNAMCALCAETCERCADDCERLGDMEVCVTACRHCAESCRAMLA